MGHSIKSIADGQFRYCYVYALMGHDGPDVYAKIGMTQNLHSRLNDLVVECPTPPRYAAFVRIMGRGRALTIERMMHIALKKWRVKGEWFKFTHAEKQEVNLASRTVLALLSVDRGLKPLQWQRMNIGALTARGELRQKKAAA
jgi:Meiotically Up-regulated Gene 113 (MUG113) protein